MCRRRSPWLTLLLVVALLAALIYFQKNGGGSGQSALLTNKNLDRLSEDMTSLKDNINLQIGERLDKSQALMVGSLQKQFSKTPSLSAK